MAHDTPTRWSGVIAKPWGENTTVRLGLVLGACGVLGGAIFWAATLRSDVNYMRDEMRMLRTEVREVLNDHEGRLRAEERRP